ncbi:unnamed protein product [Rotaria socialis]|uniref:Striatin N-terminal domain-containing protein n=1 Tax=Rotaria socialis TaxID=392032 RepID=A0A817UZY8_9BILA|nr:unnamed protein product [Rotaria socialis]CAF3193052.1 unnamed protein product [Rotaria socialis]CAF3335932.1 unnamed protein product [Rotaria socialis]CAF4188015.1 unnamed protein product [Rotaria socialis]CAF4207697.1 unnamed protein product [Rotaria socialis]
MDGSETQISYQTDSQAAASAMANVDAQRPLYTVPGILHFLQHEWTRFEIERQQWETERAEFQARIAFLQGERQGQENLKNALVRRIKMLEYALKQERLKFNKLKYGSENAPVEDHKSTSNDAPHYDDDENKDGANLGYGDNSVSFKQGRQLLRQYLKEIGYVDTIIDIRSTAVKKLLGIKSETNFNASNNNNNNNNNNISLNGDIKPSNESKRIIPNIVKNATSDLSKSVLASLVFLKEDQPDEDSSDDDIDSSRIMIKSNNGNTTNHNSGLDTLNDLDGEEVALHEFDFLSGESAASSNVNQMKPNENNSADWDVDQSRLNRLKEEYKRERYGKQHQHHTSNSSSIRNNLFDNGNDDTSSDPRAFSTDEQINRGMVDTIMFRNSKNFMGDNAMDGLDELARVTVLNDNEPQDDTTATDSSDFRKTWNVKYVLRSHLDGIHCVTFHPVESVVITGSEDRTLKLWNLEKAAVLRKSASTTQDLEPIYTFRRHTGPVLCVAMNPSGEQFYSGGLDSIISVWNIPNSDVDPYDAYDSNVLCKVLEGHTDAVWQLAISGQKLLSCSSDGSVRLWDSNLSQSLQSTFTNDGIPLSIDWIMQDTNQFVATYDSLKTMIFDAETGKVVTQLANDNSTADANYRVNRVISHPSQPIIITAHDDKKIRYFDSNSGRMIHSMVAHLETVTALAIDPQQTCLLSGSHDRSIRLWNFETKNCIQEFTAHQKKDDESIHDVAFHLSKPYMASVGADSIAKIYA